MRDLGIDHIYIKPRTLRLNDKFEGSYLINDQQFDPLIKSLHTGGSIPSRKFGTNSNFEIFQS